MDIPPVLHVVPLLQRPTVVGQKMLLLMFITIWHKQDLDHRDSVERVILRSVSCGCDFSFLLSHVLLSKALNPKLSAVFPVGVCMYVLKSTLRALY